MLSFFLTAIKIEEKNSLHQRQVYEPHQREIESVDDVAPTSTYKPRHCVNFSEEAYRTETARADEINFREEAYRKQTRVRDEIGYL